MARASEDISGVAAARTLVLACLALVLSLATWFSATAVLPQLRAEWRLTDAAAAWLTISVQLGFVAGAVGSAALGLADRIAPNRLMAAGAIGAALANAGLLIAYGLPSALVFRAFTGACLALVYPPALKLLSTWFVKGRGLALGCAIGALTVGSALPHLINATLDLAWRDAVRITSLSTILGSIMALGLLRTGPFPFTRAPFDIRDLGAVLANRGFRLATGGYLGHMWELYAMWAWLLILVRLRLGAEGGASLAALITFAAIAAGAPACILAGWLADRLGRPAATMGAMVVSGGCAAVIGFTYGGPLWLFVFVAVLWGASVIADSAQFSALITEYGDPRFVGTALTIQLGCGFALTGLSIWLLPMAAGWLGTWRWAPLLLVPGPVLGVAAISRLLGRSAAAQPRTA